jgi:hypothetical protein
MKKKKLSQSFPIPEEVLINACNEASRHFKTCADTWGEEERCFVRKICGETYKHIESDLIGRMAINLRKRGVLEATRGGKTKRALQKPFGAYAKYLQSKHWREFRLKILEFWEFRCAICKNRNNLEVHHNTYERIGRERMQDCIAVCRDCHKTIHHKMPEGNEQFVVSDCNLEEGLEVRNGDLLF